jgi:uncharacterized protein with PQ loop repeat
MQEEKQLTEKESLELITRMINKAKEACHDTGISAIMWGIVIAFCSLEKLSEIQFGYTLPFDIYLLTLLAVIPQVFISIREKRKRKVRSYDDVFQDYLWLGFGISVFLMSFIVSTMYSEWEPAANEFSKLAGHSSSFRFYEFNSSFFLLLYGMPTFVTGTSMKFKPMIWGGLVCWASSIISIYTPIKIDLLLVAFSAVFAWLLPGILLESDYRKAKSGLAEKNV